MNLKFFSGEGVECKILKFIEDFKSYNNINICYRKEYWYLECKYIFLGWKGFNRIISII